MMMKWIMLILGVAVSLQACLVMPQSYFKPASDDGEVIRTVCRGAVGPYDALEVDALGIPISVKFTKVHGGIAYTFRYRVPESQSVTWLTTEVTITVNDGPEQSATLDEYTMFDYRQQTATQIRAGEKTVSTIDIWPNGHQSVREGFSGKYTLKNDGDIKLEKVEVSPIALLVNDQRFEIPKITFENRFGVFIYPINC